MTLPKAGRGRYVLGRDGSGSEQFVLLLLKLDDVGV